jgi:predicted transcriptional regulator of viral defense system
MFGFKRFPPLTLTMEAPMGSRRNKADYHYILSTIVDGDGCFTTEEAKTAFGVTATAVVSTLNGMSKIGLLARTKRGNYKLIVTDTEQAREIVLSTDGRRLRGKNAQASAEAGA